MLPFDGMRGITAIGVAAFHVNPASPFLFWAWTLVDMFFVLSGFLIGTILYRGISEGTLSLKNFWMRRILRIWPVYYMTLAVVTLAAFASSAHSVPLKELIRSLLFLQFTGGYLHPGTSWDGMIIAFIPWFSHSWSIAAEEQFYLLLPVFLWLFGVSVRSIFMIVIAALVLSQMLLHADIIPTLLGTRMQGLALGLLLVPLSQWLRASPANAASMPRRAAISIIACGLIAGLFIMVPIFMRVVPVLWSGGTVDREVGKTFARASILGMALIYFGVAGMVMAFPQGALARGLSARVLVYLGSISYAVYMFHVPVEGLLITVRGQALATDSLMIKAAYWIVILGLAHLSKILIENRFNAYKDRYPVYRKPA
jgi:peptidoglycan/LPS O-acetylase OafA/YrhL